MGLAGVKNMVEERFGGRITVASELGMGAVFTVEIPAARLVFVPDGGEGSE